MIRDLGGTLSKYWFLERRLALGAPYSNASAIVILLPVLVGESLGKIMRSSISSFSRVSLLSYCSSFRTKSKSSVVSKSFYLLFCMLLGVIERFVPNYSIGFLKINI